MHARLSLAIPTAWSARSYDSATSSWCDGVTASRCEIAGSEAECCKRRATLSRLGPVVNNNCVRSIFAFTDKPTFTQSESSCRVCVNTWCSASSASWTLSLNNSVSGLSSLMLSLFSQTMRLLNFMRTSCWHAETALPNLTSASFMAFMRSETSRCSFSAWIARWNPAVAAFRAALSSAFAWAISCCARFMSAACSALSFSSASLAASLFLRASRASANNFWRRFSASCALILSASLSSKSCTLCFNWSDLLFSSQTTDNVACSQTFW
mmetsp:Transcript_69957/g.214570  ORF Transcript_69957/g.214570 Transcript_69957/m.214570 type:complete len:268 (-) Transcript_69957:256-1059(-)